MLVLWYHAIARAFCSSGDESDPSRPALPVNLRKSEESVQPVDSPLTRVYSPLASVYLPLARVYSPLAR
eukprot:1454588-Pyramimonas_sp.AAC.1